MKALTIHPVWAWAIVHGHKRVENRTWRTHHRGPLLIHASADSPAARQSDAAARETLSALGVAVPQDVPQAALVGIVEVVEVLRYAELAADPLAAGPYCWILNSPLAFPPIPYRGQQGVFEVPGSCHGEPIELKPLETQPPPKMAWVLVGLPVVRFSEIAERVESLAGVEGIILETTQNDGQKNR